MADEQRPARPDQASDPLPVQGSLTAMAAVDLSDAKRELLAKMMRGEAGKRAGPSAITRRAADAVVPLTAAQRQVWLHAVTAPDTPLYNESITIHRLGSFDLAIFEASFRELLRRHESWRTSFSFQGAEPVQIIHPEVSFDLKVDDISHLPAAERDAAALTIGTADAMEPIDLTMAPLFRARIVKLADDNHRFYLTLHHIIFDGVAIYRVIIPELAAIYDAFSAGRPSPLSDPEIGYGDYALWQQDYLEGPQIRNQIGYWQTALADAPPKLELTGDRPRPIEPTYAGSMEVFTIDAGLTEALKALSLSRGVTLYMTLLAAFKAMLHRYSGETDIIVGGVTDVRRRPELERVVGYFLNTLALRSRPAGELRFSDYLQQVRDTMLGALGASEVPFDEVVRTLNFKRTAGTHPLFNILFSVEPPVDPFPAGWDLTQMDVVVGGAKFDLYLELDERPEGMIGRFLYSTELFDAGTIRRMIAHWLTMLQGVVDNADCELARLPLITEADARAIERWNATARPAACTTLTEAVAAQIAASPDASAIIFGDQTVTYRKLDAQADSIAAALQRQGIRRGSLVAIAIERSPAMVAAMLGILRVGAAYLPLDPNFPAARLSYIIEDAAPDLLLTEDALAGQVPFPQGSVLRIEDIDPAERRSGSAAFTANDLAYVLYTSGSTGRPKGVEIEHRALINLLDSMRHEPGFTARDSLLSVTTPSFDIAMLELFLPLISGGRLIIAPAGTVRDPGALKDLIETARPTVMQATPTMWQALVDAGWPGAATLKILSGGEPLARSLADDLATRSAQLWNMYGPTETTIWSTVHKVEPGSGPVAIGRPIANTQTYVLDQHGRSVPPGVIGELYIGGTGLARGYRRQPGLTGERFAERPAAPGVRLYRTGDLARQSSDGSLFCLGRTDNDLKIRGFRIAVEEIEGALARLDGVSAAAVRSWPDGQGGQALTAYVVATSACPATSELRSDLERLLPDYMIPSRFVHLQDLPTTPNGKTDRKALPPPVQEVMPQEIAPPTGLIEEQLAVIWSELLNGVPVSRHDRFMDLGGHSLLVAKLIRRVETKFGKKISMASFFRAQRLDEMARLLEGDHQAMAYVPIQPNGWRPPLLWLEGTVVHLPLAKALGQDQPFLGVPFDEVLVTRPGETKSFEEYASDLIRVIRKIQPEGPYYLGGWCVAGLLAYEVGIQLRAAGDEVALLLLGDVVNPETVEPAAMLGASKLFSHVRQLVHPVRGTRSEYVRERLENLLIKLQLRPANPHWSGDPAREALDMAALAYRPGIFDRDVAMFHSSWITTDLVKADWASRIEGATIAQQFPAPHAELLKSPNIEQAAVLLKEQLVAAQARSSRPEPTPLRIPKAAKC
jgi:amino acid adenylation domain-containing protein